MIEETPKDDSAKHCIKKQRENSDEAEKTNLERIIRQLTEATMDLVELVCESSVKPVVRKVLDRIKRRAEDVNINLGREMKEGSRLKRRTIDFNKKSVGVQADLEEGGETAKTM